MTNIKDVKSFVSRDSVGVVTLTNIANADLALGLKGAATNSINATYTAAAVAGTSDTLNVSLNGATASSIVVNSGFEAVKVTTTAESTLATLTAPGAASLTLSGAAKLTVNDGTIDAFKTVVVNASGETRLGTASAIRTLDASTASGAITQAAITSAGLDNGMSNKTLTLDTTGGLIQTGSGADNVRVSAANVFSTNATTAKLGAGADKLYVEAVGNGGFFAFGEAGDDTVFVGANLLAANLIDGGEGSDTVNFAANTTNTFIARSIEKIGLQGATGEATVVNLVSPDTKDDVTDGSVGARL